MQNILITGSEGNIGAFLSERAHKNPQWHTIGVTLHPPSEPHTDEVIVGDLTDPHFVAHIFALHEIDTVIHAAAPAYQADKIKNDPFGTFANDLGCLLNVLRYATSIKHFVYLSSATVYEGAAVGPFAEDLTEHIAPPSSPVGLAKYTGEHTLKFWSVQHGIPYTIWRMFNVISPRENHLTSGGHVYVDFYRKLFVERVPELEIFGDGKQVRCFSWVEDVVDAIVRFCDDPRTNNQIYNLGAHEPKTLIELKDTLLKIGKDKKMISDDYVPEIKSAGTFFGKEATIRIPDLKKISTELDWRAPTSFYDCFEQFIEQKRQYANT